MIIERAVASGLPTTPGTTTGLATGSTTGTGPLDTTSRTGVLGTTRVPPAGVLLITTPLATVLLGFSVTGPTTKFAPAIADRACATDVPASCGTATCTGDGGAPLDTTSATRAPGATCTPSAGVLLITTPFATVSLGFSVTWPTDNFASEIAARAAASDRPTSCGTATPTGPLDTTRSTALPRAGVAPAAGVWPRTVPSAAASDFRVTVPSRSPAASIERCAAATEPPTTPGTVAGVGAGAAPVPVSATAARPETSGTFTRRLPDCAPDPLGANEHRHAADRAGRQHGGGAGRAVGPEGAVDRDAREPNGDAAPVRDGDGLRPAHGPRVLFAEGHRRRRERGQHGGRRGRCRHRRRAA